jgi:adenosine deaminase
MTVSNTDVKTEFKHLIDTFNLSQFDVYNLLKNSIDYSFTSKETKQKLLALLNEKIDGYYKELIK